MYCDLHIHSDHSDGTCSPTQIVAMAKQLGLTVALTDHNTVSGLPEFLRAAREQNVTAVGGTELSTAHGDKELHLLGLFIEPKHYDTIEQVTRHFSLLKEQSNMELVRRLQQAGYAVDYARIEEKYPKGNINRAHVGAELMAQGYVSSVEEAFRTLLDDDLGFYVPSERLQTTYAIQMLRQMGAIPILAHPLQDLTQQELRKILPSLIEAGLLGMEVFHSSYDAKAHELAVQIAEEFALLPSGGSDFHGTVKPTIQLGVGEGHMRIPAKIYENLLQLYENQ
ncbi:MAG: PHP domain-containing protein [Oscillospiraceae bacterium]|nr:PHP domain-containing protein [Oscillospiraceae bacterium]